MIRGAPCMQGDRAKGNAVPHAILDLAPPPGRLTCARLADPDKVLHFLETTLGDEDDYTGDGVSILERVRLCCRLMRRCLSTRGPRPAAVAATARTDPGSGTSPAIPARSNEVLAGPK